MTNTIHAVQRSDNLDLFTQYIYIYIEYRIIFYIKVLLKTTTRDTLLWLCNNNITMVHKRQRRQSEFTGVLHTSLPTPSSPACATNTQNV